MAGNETSKQAGSWASTPAVRRSMQGNRSRDTGPELAIRRLVHATGLRYRVDAPPLAGLRRRADLVFSRAKVAVFVDGCFWHGCAQHYVEPGTNREYWTTKVRTNRARDQDTTRRLRDAGWEVVRVWEHENPHDAAARVVATVKDHKP
ncbi:very short patch repair endonuclease [Umezawaea sp. NPDC059074]|uniref:very short patch repair endonuclease n=1 Tax=Umezawaea sp. NPDC059074 TaxID=3346716 RepID=UPI0036978F8D